MWSLPSYLKVLMQLITSKCFLVSVSSLPWSPQAHSGGGRCGFSWIWEVSLHSTRKNIFLHYPAILSSKCNTRGWLPIQTGVPPSLLVEWFSIVAHVENLIHTNSITFSSLIGLGRETWGSPGPWCLRNWLRDLWYRIYCFEKRTQRKRCAPLFPISFIMTLWMRCLEQWQSLSDHKGSFLE